MSQDVMQDQLKKSFEKLRGFALRDGVELELLAAGGEGLSLSFQKGRVDAFESSVTRVAGLRVVDGPAQGYASTENLSDEGLERTYRDALMNARTIKEQAKGPALPLATPKPLVDEMTDLYRPQNVAIERKLEIAKQLEALPLTKDPRVSNVPYSRMNERSGWRRLLNTKGLDRFHQSTSYSGYSYVLAKDGESSKMDGDSFFTRDFDQIDAEKVTTEAVRRATSRLGAKPLETGRYPVLMDRTQSGTLLSMIEAFFSAKSVHENTSLFKDRLGQPVASNVFTLIDDPFDRRGGAARPFDSEGMPSQKTPLIENGILKSYLTNLEWSEKMKLPHTASAARGPSSEMDVGSSNLVVKLGTESREQLLKKKPKMLWLTEFSGGLHAGYKEASGNFSLPAEGFWVENGQVVGPVEQFVVSGNVLDAMKDIIGVGDTYDVAGSSHLIPDLLFGELSVAGAK